jgi:hypothetical protein
MSDDIASRLRATLRNTMRTGKVGTVGAPVSEVVASAASLTNASVNPATPSVEDDFLSGASVPGVFPEKTVASVTVTAEVKVDPSPEAREPLEQNSAAKPESPASELVKSTPARSLEQRLKAEVASNSEGSKARKEMAAMKTLTRLLEAVYTRPGSTASDTERMMSLSTLSNRSFELGTVVARVAGDDAERSSYVRAMAMDAAVGLVCKAWEQNREIDWASIIEASANAPEIDLAANELAQATYRPVQTAQDASERLSVSMHAAFWQVYSLGDAVNGITPRVAAEIIRDCANYLQTRERFVNNNDLHVSWMQGSIRRMCDLVCAEMRARFSNVEAPTKADIDVVLSTARSGFEGVENYAQIILETPVNRPEPRPVG